MLKSLFRLLCYGNDRLNSSKAYLPRLSYYYLVIKYNDDNDVILSRLVRKIHTSRTRPEKLYFPKKKKKSVRKLGTFRTVGKKVY